MVKAELLLGAYKSSKSETLERTKQFLELFEVIPFSDEMSCTCAKIRKELESKGKTIGANVPTQKSEKNLSQKEKQLMQMIYLLPQRL